MRKTMILGSALLLVMGAQSVQGHKHPCKDDPGSYDCREWCRHNQDDYYCPQPSQDHHGGGGQQLNSCNGSVSGSVSQYGASINLEGFSSCGEGWSSLHFSGGGQCVLTGHGGRPTNVLLQSNSGSTLDPHALQNCISQSQCSLNISLVGDQFDTRSSLSKDLQSCTFTLSKGTLLITPTTWTLNP